MNDNNLNTNSENGLNNNTIPGVTPVAPVEPVVSVESNATQIPTEPIAPVEPAIPEMPAEPAVQPEPTIPEMPSEPVISETSVETTSPVPPVETAPQEVTAETTLQTDTNVLQPSAEPLSQTDNSVPMPDATVSAPVATDAQAVEQTPKKKNNLVLIIILVLVILGAVGYAVYTFILKDNNTKEETTPVTETCAVVSNYENYIPSETGTSVVIGGKTYKFSANNVVLFDLAFDYKTNVDVNVCTKGDEVTKFTLLNKLDGSTIVATTEAELRTQLGLNAFGTHTAEKATLINIDALNPIDEIVDGKTQKYYNIVLKLSDGVDQTCKYVITDTAKDNAKTLVVGKEYTVDYELVEGEANLGCKATSIK